MTRRPDGSVVACIYAPLLGRHLTAYTPDGTVLWDRTIADAGPVASDSEGNLYVRVSPTEIRVYDAVGSFHHQWFGPPGQPLAGVSDIASSRDGTRLFALVGGITGPVKVYSQLPTPATPMSWGRIKAIYR